MDIKKTTFTYDYNKRSASSLLYVSSMDPWTRKGELHMDGFHEIGENDGDPWIKRNAKTSRHTQWGVCSFSTAFSTLFENHKRCLFFKSFTQRSHANQVCQFFTSSS
ncbi:hypothetical protein ACLKA7_008330 [Drosophila subpalustris]